MGAPSGSKAKILVVEDNPALRENLVEALELEGYEVVASAEGAAALERLLADRSLRVVLLDLSMPGMDGRQLLARIRAEPSLGDVRVVVTTGHTEPRARSGIPADGFLLKPFGVREVLAALEKVGA